jgi:MFS transporter, DHA1 family, multidrug resistance protein
MTLDRRPTAPLWLLAVFTFSGPVGMHIFVPALPAAAKDLHATPAALELTISLYILGLAVGQLIYGPVSDRFGRRPALLAGLSIFTIASIAALFAPDVHTLVLARFFQAIGGCSGLVLARAIIRDISQAHEAARRLALTNLLVTAGPAVAPLIGSGLNALWGWRTILAGLAALGVANFVLAWRMLPETRPEVLFVSASRYARDYVGLLRSREFLGYAVGGACATTSLYAFIACAPFIFIDRLHVPSASVGLYLALLVSGIWLGSLLASQLIARFSLTRFVVVANAVSVVAAASFLGFVIADRATLVAIVGTMFVFSVGVGAAAPAALVKAISVNLRVTGTASGLYGSVQMAVAGTLVMLAGWGANPALASASVLLAAGLVAQASFWIARNRSPAVATPESEGASQRPRPDSLKRRVLRAGRGSRSEERLPWWGAPAREALWRPCGS